VREQFGRPLAAFQALRHRLADAFTRVETLRSHVYYAAWVADYRPAQITEWAQMAKGLAGGSCWDVANEAIQLHGAMGFTWEMGLQHQVGRVIARTLSHPSAQECLERVGAAMARRGHMIQLVE
jgi:alkylation response protein AidB-like acyl-CoA dehydrogenase